MCEKLENEGLVLWLQRLMAINPEGGRCSSGGEDNLICLHSNNS